MTGDRLGELLRAALPPTEEGGARSDAWPSLLERLNERPRWSLLDVGLGAAALAALLLFPERLLLLVYHF